jgi:calcineurin-like phosphoesterase family protein
MAVYFISDLHLGHERLCKGLRQMSAEESDELIINNWNKIVKKKDVVYILGDIVMEDPKKVEGYLNRLHGIKYIIGGNHDTRKVCQKYQELNIPVMGCVEYKGFICTHIPIHPNEVKFFKGNIHGHIHLKGKLDESVYNPTDPIGRYYNVNCEFHNYTPIPFEKIEAWFNSIDENKTED